MVPMTQDPSDHTPRFLSYQQYAAARGVSVDTVKRQAQRGEITVIKLSPRRRGIPVSELDKPAS
jgi:hypothetical protein